MNRLFFTIFIGLVFFQSCNLRKKQAENNLKPDMNKSEEIQSAIIKSALNFEYLSISGKVDISGPIEQSLGIKIRMKRSEILWVSLQVPFIGTEAIRAYIDKDSIKVLSPFQKEYYPRSIKQLSEIAGVNLSLDQLQNAFIGNSIMGYTKNSRISADADSIYAQTQEAPLNIKETLYLNNFRPAYTQIIHEKQNSFFSVLNSDFSSSEKGLKPDKIIINAITAKDRAGLKLEYNSFDFKEITNFPFNVPASYQIR